MAFAVLLSTFTGGLGFWFGRRQGAADAQAVPLERQILDRMAFTTTPKSASAVVTTDDILKARALVDQIYVDDKIKDYVLSIVFATRDPDKYRLDIKPYIRYGASPRATIFLTLAAKANAFIAGRGYVTPQDVKIWGLPGKNFMAVPVISILAFAGYVAIGVITRKKPAIHRPMMFMAVMATMAAAVTLPCELAMWPDLGMSGPDRVASPSTWMLFCALDSMDNQFTSHHF